MILSVLILVLFKHINKHSICFITVHVADQKFLSVSHKKYKLKMDLQRHWSRQKSYDGVSGILKHLASKHNLAKDSTMAITNAEEFVRIIKPRTSIKETK